MDPRISGFMSNQEDSPNGDPWGSEGGMEERMLARRAEKMYQELAARGKFSEIDKAKHNENYRNYLLSNFDENEYW